jgi:hypothetical protein
MVFNSLAELSKASVAVITGKVASVGIAYVDEGQRGEGAKDAKHGTVLTPVSFMVESVVAGNPKARFFTRLRTYPSVRLRLR